MQPWGCCADTRLPSCVLYMAFDTECQRLNPLQQQEAVEGRQGRTRVALANGPAPRDIGGGAVVIRVDNAVIGGLRPVQHVKALRIVSPREFSTIYDHSTECRAVPPHEFRHGM